MIRILTALLLVGAAVAQAKSSTSSTSLRMTREDAIFHRDALIDAVHKKARKLVDSTSENGASVGDAESICGYIQESMNFQSVGSKNATGDCTCSGTIEDTLELGCSFQLFYSDTGEVCGSVDMNIKLSNLVDGEGNFSDNPEMEIDACVDVVGEWMEEICLTLVLSGYDFSAPQKCEMTYDQQECMCNLSSVQVDETFDIEVPCMVWNCSDVVPDSLKPYMAQDTCGLSSGTGNATSVDPISSSFTALEEIPPDVVTESQVESGAITAHLMVRGVSIGFVLSTAFLAWF